MRKLPFMVDFSNKLIVITGAGGIICGELAQALVQTNAKLALIDIDEEAVKALASSLNALYPNKVFAYKADVLDKESLKDVHNNILNDLGTCDFLINGAGGNHPTANTTHHYYQEIDLNKDEINFFNLKIEGFKHVFDLNFLGTFLPTQEFAIDMVEKEDASILNLSSMNAIKSLTKLPAYSAAKAGISNFTEWLAIYFSKTGIRVNALAPGFFITNQNRKNLIAEDGSFTQRANDILAATPMNRFGDVHELVGAVLFLLCKEASGFVNGIVLPIDGGFQTYCGV